MDRLRVASVGCGPRGMAHMAALLGGGAGELVAVCDVHEDRLAEAGGRFGVPPGRRFRQMGEMIARVRPDLVDIVTQPTDRVGLVQWAVEAGARNILIEKPIALRPSESWRLAALGSECFIAVNTQYQWMPHWQRFWGLLEQRALGEVRTIRCGTRTNILEQGPHVADLALKAADLSGLPEPQWVLAGCGGLERFGDVPVPADNAATVGLGEARMLWNQGPSAAAVPGETVFWYHIAVEVVGTAGRLWVSLNRGWELWLNGRPVERGDTAWPRDDGLAQAAMFAELRDRIHSGTTAGFPTRIEVAARNADLMFACYASALGGGRIDLPAELPDSLVDRLETLDRKEARP